jgi:lysophospholipase
MQVTMGGTVLLMALLFGPTAAGALDNPYKLTLEQDLDISSPRIVEFWAKGSQGEVQGKGGVRLKYWMYSSESRGAADEAIVIANGRTESFVKYSELAYDLSQRGYSIYILDHRGQGLSGRMLPDRQIGHVEHFDDYVQDFNTFVREVVAQQGHKRLLLLAHSMGGAIASLYLERYPSDFAKAALSSPMHEPATPGLLPQTLACGDVKEMLARITGTENDYVFTKGPYRENETFKSDNGYTHSEKRYALERKAYDDNPDARLGGPSKNWAVRACEAGATARARKNADKITVPVLLVSARADKVVTATGQEEFCKNVNAADPGRCTLVRIAGGAHELFVESDAYRVPALTRILQFFGAPLPSPP